MSARDTSKNNPTRSSGSGDIALTCNVKNKEDVDSGIRASKKAGSTIVKEPQDTFWGGYHVYFADPDGYYRDVAWGPGFKFDKDGLLKF